MSVSVSNRAIYSSSNRQSQANISHKSVMLCIYFLIIAILSLEALHSRIFSLILLKLSLSIFVISQKLYNACVSFCLRVINSLSSLLFLTAFIIYAVLLAVTVKIYCCNSGLLMLSSLVKTCADLLKILFICSSVLFCSVFNIRCFCNSLISSSIGLVPITIQPSAFVSTMLNILTSKSS